MNKILRTIFLFSVLILLYSCSKDDTPVTPGNPTDTSTNFKYPYTINSNWFFTTTTRYTFRPDSIRKYFTSIDTSDEVGFAIWKNDTVVNGINARILRTNHTSPNHSFNTTETYIQTDTGLVNLTFVPNVSFGPFRPNGYSEFSYEGFFGNMDSTVNPINCLKYPIVINSEWFFRNLSSNQVQRKKYLGYEQISTPAGTYNCVKIQRINYQNGVNDTNVVDISYFSKAGMVKRTRKVSNNPFVYSGLTGYYDINQETILNLVEIE